MKRFATALLTLFSVSTVWCQEELSSPSIDLPTERSLDKLVQVTRSTQHSAAPIDPSDSAVQWIAPPIELVGPAFDQTKLYQGPIIDEGPENCQSSGRCGNSDVMNVRNYSLLDYRRMFLRHRAPTPAEMAGTWRGVNKGIVRLVGIKQFIKEIQPCGSVTFGDNIEVHQVSDQMLRCCGWQPKFDSRTGLLKRNGKYMVQRPNFRGPFGHGAIFSYRDGGNRLGDPRRVIVDKVVLLDCNHLLGRASVRIGLVQIPVGYFVLERM